MNFEMRCDDASKTVKAASVQAAIQATKAWLRSGEWMPGEEASAHLLWTDSDGWKQSATVSVKISTVRA